MNMSTTFRAACIVAMIGLILAVVIVAMSYILLPNQESGADYRPRYSIDARMAIVCFYSIDYISCLPCKDVNIDCSENKSRYDTEIVYTY